jgi:hypothetical protein
MDQPHVEIASLRSTPLGRTATTTRPSSRRRAPGRRTRHLLGVLVLSPLLAAIAHGSDDGILASRTLPADDPGVRRFVIQPVADPLRADEAVALARLLADRRPDDALILGGLPKRVFRKMQQAYPLALRQVREVESCRDLFADLGADGVATLGTTVFRPATRSRDMEVCTSRGAVAFTTIGRPHTRVCDGFARLPQREAAMILIHEALHHAGLSEYPHDPDGPRSTEINRLVRMSCGL